MEDDIWDIYKITCLVNNKLYIGISVTGFRKRFKRHLRDAIRNEQGALYNSIRKHGPENFYVELITQCYSAKEAELCERAQIAQFGSMRPRGYNLTSGGIYGGRFAAESKERMSAARLGKINSPSARAKISAALKGKTRDPIAVAKTAAALKGRKPSPQTIEAVKRKLTGVPISDEQKAKISAYHKGRPKSEEHKAKIAAANTGYKHTPEARARMSESHKGKTFSEEHLNNLKTARAKRILGPDFSAAVSAGTKSKPKSEEHKAALKAARLRRTERERADPELTAVKREKNRLAALKRWHPEKDHHNAK